MIRLLIITQESEKLTELGESLAQNGLSCSITTYNNGVMESITRQSPDILLVEMDASFPNPDLWESIHKLKQERPLPTIALVPEEILGSVDGRLDVDDFLTSPYDARELSLRARRLLRKIRGKDSSECVRCNDLVIDLAKCEVTVDDKVVKLTFKEYELLKLLASNRGRVYTREALLNKIWGYDYYGGDRTVDVHVRRLRSKIDDPKHSFIETVRNIGYRFRRDM